MHFGNLFRLHSRANVQPLEISVYGHRCANGQVPEKLKKPCFPPMLRKSFKQQLYLPFVFALATGRGQHVAGS